MEWRRFVRLGRVARTALAVALLRNGSLFGRAGGPDDRNGRGNGHRPERRAAAGRDRRAREPEPAGRRVPRSPSRTAATGSRAFRPGAYKVTAELSGFGKVQKTATVTLDATATVNLQLSLSTSAEVTVTGEAPLVDVTSTTQGTQLQREGHRQAAGRPQLRGHRVHAAGRAGGLRRDAGPLAGDLDLRIDVVGEPVPDRRRQHDERHQGLPGQGHQQRVHPGSRSEDGRLPGRVRPQHGRRHQRHHEVGRQRVPRRRVRLLQRHRHARRHRRSADAANYAARGDFSQTGDAQFRTTSSSKDVRQEFGADLGGFIMKDKVWFFGAYDRVKINQDLQPLDRNPTRSDEDFPIGYLPEQVLGQADVQPAPGHVDRRQRLLRRADAARRDRDRRRASRRSSYNGRLDTGGPDYGARLNQLFGSFGIFTFQYAQHKDRYDTKPVRPRRAGDPRLHDGSRPGRARTSRRPAASARSSARR